MKNPLRFMPFLAFLAASLLAAPAKKAEGLANWLRFKEAPRVDELQVAIGHFKHPKTGVTVDLVGAIHIGDRTYYRDLNKRFKEYDSVLFELVADPKRAHKPRGPSNSPVTMIQRAMQRFLDLDFQLDAIKYNRPNFIHADMDPKTFAKRQRARGETMLNLMLKTMREEMARKRAGEEIEEITPAELLIALLSPNRAREMKRLLAANMGTVEDALSSLEGEEGTVILTERNQVALKVLRRTLQEGEHKKIAIFYGAAHMPDMERRLKKEFGMERQGLTWVSAWRMPK
ncbi:MAG: hypothetical protein CMO74_06695 [Verrucomicrobiales bacterium]|nr:hypothetical protein [Verrucomicrobiales bacterium]|tara:strand:+ start:70173 stop:71033 length:861 start_codon:yes stop_codon:yes gene_type:complete